MLVAQAAAVTGISQSGQGIKKAGGQAAQAAVAQAGIRLLAPEPVPIQAQSGQGLIGRLPQAEGQNIVAQQPAHEELHGQIVDPLRAAGRVGLFGGHHAFGGQIPDSQAETDQLVVIRRRVRAPGPVIAQAFEIPVHEPIGDAADGVGGDKVSHGRLLILESMPSASGRSTP